MGKNGLTRRDFLKLVGITLAGLPLTACTVEAAKRETSTATPSPSLHPSPTATPQPLSLRELADKAKFELGASSDGWLIEDPRFYENLKSSFNLTALNWGVIWNEFEPVKGRLDYSRIDRCINNLRQNGLEGSTIIRGHPIYFPEVNPAWLVDGNFSSLELTEILINHVTEMVSHYKGIVKQWVVVNEPFLTDYPSWRPKDVMYLKLGSVYIDLAFQAARDADPSATLIFNDTDNHTPHGTSTKQTRAIVERLNSKGLIDGVGCQMHLDGSYAPWMDDVILTMQGYGVPVYVTELDVDLSRVTGTSEERYAKQATIFADVLKACLDSTVCHSLNVWGMAEKFSWLEKGLGRPNADGTLYDDQFQPKPAYFAMKDVLEKYANGL